jgi:tetratricopeptide (TPR) repeat protein
MKAAELRAQFLMHMELSDWESAEQALDDWRKLGFAAFEPNFHRIFVLMKKAEVRAARELAFKFFESCKCNAEWFKQSLFCLQQLGAHDVLLKFVQRHFREKQIDARVLADAAIALTRIGAHTLAHEVSSKALQRAPNDASCLNTQGIVLGYLGKVGPARDVLQRLIKLHPDYGMPYWLMSRLERQLDSSLCAQIESTLDRLGSSAYALDRAYLNYARFKCYDDLGNTDAAWRSLQSAHADAGSVRGYDPAETSAQFSRLHALFDRPFASPVIPITARPKSPTPIFILGLHRSGTSLLERILGGSKDVYDLGETDRLSTALSHSSNSLDDNYPAVAQTRLADFDLAALRECFYSLHQSPTKAKFLTEKSPANFRYIGFIAAALPESKVIHVKREAMDLCFANLREIFGEHVRHPYGIERIAHYHKLYEDLMAFWHRRFPGFVLDVRYEDLVSDPERESQRIFDFCGLGWSPDVIKVETRTHAIATLSAQQVRQPINTASVARFKKYETHLAPLRALLGTS